MNEEEYIKKRLDDQIEWYSSKSNSCQKKYKRLQGISIGCATLISVIGCAGSVYEILEKPALLIASLMGAAAAIIQGLCKMNKYHENWIQYRHISELLKHEKYLFQTKTSPYDQEDAFSDLVLQTERIISAENMDWLGINETGKSKR